MTRSKTMFSASVCCSDKFAALSFEAQALYYRLNLEADGIGALNNVRSIMRAAGFGEDALRELIGKGFLLHVESDFDEVFLVADFWINNKLDRRNVGRSEHKEVVTSKCCFQSERIRRYVLLNGGSGCIQTGYSLNAVLEPSQTQIKPTSNKTKGTQTSGTEAAERQSPCELPCPECNCDCLASVEGGLLHGWCQLHGDFFFDKDAGVYVEGLA